MRKIRNLLGPEALHSAIRATGRNLAEAGQLLSERLINEADQLPVHALPAALGIVVDRSQLLVGQPTMIVGHKSVPSPEDVKRMFDALPKIEVTSVSNAEPRADPTASAAPKTQVKASTLEGFFPRSDRCAALLPSPILPG